MGSCLGASSRRPDDTKSPDPRLRNADLLSAICRLRRSIRTEDRLSNAMRCVTSRPESVRVGQGAVSAASEGAGRAELGGIPSGSAGWFEVFLCPSDGEANSASKRSSVLIAVLGLAAWRSAKTLYSVGRGGDTYVSEAVGWREVAVERSALLRPCSSTKASRSVAKWAAWEWLRTNAESVIGSNGLVITPAAPSDLK